MSEQVMHFGPYEVRGELGRGAMARVWRAWDPKLEREVAIKVPIFNPSLPESTLEEMGRRFVAEGHAAAKLNHPNICTIFNADVYDGYPAIVMELVDGTTLSDLLDRGPLASIEALSVLDQLLDAVGFAHGKGVVHRDIKPDNIFVTSDGRVKLADFGIARIDGGEATQVTMMGTVLGTPGYMSPEQAQGLPADGRSDIFSVGVVGYEMLSGRNPFGAGDGSNPTTVIYRIVHEPVPELPASVGTGLASDLRPAIMKALSKDPANRPQTAQEFKLMLHGEAAASYGAIPPVSPPNSDKRMSRWVPYAIVAFVCAAVVGALFVFATSGNGGGGAGAGGDGVATSKTSAATTQQTSPKYYLAINTDGSVAVYKDKIGDGSNPERVTDIASAALPSDIVAQLKDGIEFDTLDEANGRVKEYRAWLSELSSTKGSADKESAAGNATATDTSRAATPADATPANQEAKPAEAPDTSSAQQPFWGVWIGASKDRTEAQSIADEASAKGLPSAVWYTTDWSNLNTEPWFVISVGTSSTQQEAAEWRDRAQGSGYSDAYVKYSGSRQ